MKGHQLLTAGGRIRRKAVFAFIETRARQAQAAFS
jgi:hypothetical protein